MSRRNSRWGGKTAAARVPRPSTPADPIPILYYSRGATCWRPAVKGLTIMVNSVFNGHRYEELWLDR